MDGAGQRGGVGSGDGDEGGGRRWMVLGSDLLCQESQATLLTYARAIGSVGSAGGLGGGGGGVCEAEAARRFGRPEIGIQRI